MVYKANNDGSYFNGGLITKGDRRLGFHVIEKRLFVSINGSTTFMDWVRNLNPFNKNFMGVCRTNSSWVDEVDSLWGIIKEKTQLMKSKNNINEVVFTGHSYGGVVANLLKVKFDMMYLESDDEEYCRNISISFGMPDFHNTKGYYDDDVFDIYDFDDISRCWITKRLLNFFNRKYRFTETSIIVDDFTDEYNDRLNDHRMGVYYYTLRKLNAHRK